MDSVDEKRERLLGTDSCAARGDDRFVFGGRRFSPEEIVAELGRFLTEERAARIDAVIGGRTRRIVPVVEGVVNMGNVSAVMRSAEALGYQRFDVITDGQGYKDSRRTSQGAEKWLDVFTWDSAADAVGFLKRAGYRVLAADLGEESLPIDELDFTRPSAIVFGNERDGLSPELLELADEKFVVPLGGFVESFNVSVAAAVTLYHAYRDRMDRRGFHGDLTADEREELRAVFYLRSVRQAVRILSKAALGGGA